MVLSVSASVVILESQAIKLDKCTLLRWIVCDMSGVKSTLIVPCTRDWIAAQLCL